MAVRVIERQELASGTGIESLENLANNIGLIQDEVEPDSNLEVQITLSRSFPNLIDKGQEIENGLTALNVKTWDGTDKHVFVDENNNTYYIRFKPGNPLTASTIFLIVSVVAIFVATAIITWFLFKATTQVVPELQGQLPTILIGGIVVAGIFGISRLIRSLRGGGG